MKVNSLGTSLCIRSLLNSNLNLRISLLCFFLETNETNFISLPKERTRPRRPNKDHKLGNSLGCTWWNYKTLRWVNHLRLKHANIRRPCISYDIGIWSSVEEIIAAPHNTKVCKCGHIIDRLPLKVLEGSSPTHI